jgi:hypothetical protein
MRLQISLSVSITPLSASRDHPLSSIKTYHCQAQLIEKCTRPLLIPLIKDSTKQGFLEDGAFGQSKLEVVLVQFGR